MGRLKETCVASYSMMVCATVIVYLCMNPVRQTEAGRRSLDRTIIPTTLEQQPCQHVSGENRAEMRYRTLTHEYNFVVSLHPSSADGVVSKGIREGLFGPADRYPSVDEMHSICELANTACTTGNIFVEVGSAIGMVSLYMASRGMKVYAYDPLKPNVDRLSESRCLNHERKSLCGQDGEGQDCMFSPSNFHIFWNAVGSDSDPPLIDVESEPNNLAATMRGGGSVRARVRRVTVDETVDNKGPIEIMLLTCQGFELNALLGASGFLRSGSIRNIVWRIHSTLPDGSAKAVSIARLLQSHGYGFARLEAARAGTGGPVAMSFPQTLNYIAAVCAKGGHPSILSSI